MPLLQINHISPGFTYALWHIAEEAPVLAAQLAGIALQEDISEIRHLRKQQESFAARLAVKAVLESWGQQYHGLVKGPQGKPSLCGSAYQLSLAHAFPYAAAIVHHNKLVGIDIERPKAKLYQVATKYLNEKECKEVGQDLKKLALCWCAKEALYKMWGKQSLSLKRDFYIMPFDLATAGTLQAYVLPQAKYLTLHYAFVHDHALVFGHDQEAAQKDIV